MGGRPRRDALQPRAVILVNATAWIEFEENTGILSFSSFPSVLSAVSPPPTPKARTAHSGNATKCHTMPQKRDFHLTPLCDLRALSGESSYPLCPSVLSVVNLPLCALCGKPPHTRYASGAGLIGRSSQYGRRVPSGPGAGRQSSSQRL